MPAPRKPTKKEPVPWLLWLVLLGTIYAFWILPRQLPERPVKVDFDASAAR